MNAITPKIKRNLLRELKNKADDDEYSFTKEDYMLLFFLEFEKGIEKNGKNVVELMRKFEMNTSNYKTVTRFRSELCQFVKNIVTERNIGIGGIKIEKGQPLVYGLANEAELQILQKKFTKHLMTNTRAVIPYLEEGDKVKDIAEKLAIECEKQLDLFNKK